ncbi:MAG: hypothetical protein ACT4QF_04450 [Sporichthyaceae bacterium]
MDRRWRAARDGGLVLVATAAVAVFVAQRGSDDAVAARATLREAPAPNAERIEFLVYGAGCPAAGDELADRRVRDRVRTPTVQFRGGSIEVRFRVKDPRGKDPCLGPDPGVPYLLTLVTPPGGRTLVDGNADPPVPFAVEGR